MKICYLILLFLFFFSQQQQKNVWVNERKQKFHYFVGKKEGCIKIKTENIYKKLRNDGGLIFKLGLNFELVNTKKIFCLLLRLIVSTKVW